MDNETLVTLTSEIVTAHVSNNSISTSDVAGLIQTVFSALQSAGQPPAPAEEKREPAVSIRSSVKPDAITCLECGKKMKMLKRHLMTDHGMSPGEYRARWGLGSDYPMTATDYSARRKELAVQIGLGRKKAPAPAEPKQRKPRVRKPAPEQQAAEE